MSTKKQKSVKYPGSADVYEPYDIGAVRFDEAQNLSYAQKGVSQKNIGMNNVIAADYSTSATYAVGDYCLYQGKLYKCNTAITTAEAWTSGHWTQVIIGDKLDVLEDTVNDLDNNKADINGYYETLGVGTADQLTSKRGVTDTPENDSDYNGFTYRTTAGDTSVSDGNAQIKQIRGNMVVWNQLFNGTLNSCSSGGVQITKINSQVYRFVGTCTTNSYPALMSSISIKANHKYLIGSKCIRGNMPTGNFSLNICSQFGVYPLINNTNIYTASTSDSSGIGVIYYANMVMDCDISFICIDLTQMFGAGYMPTTVTEFKKMFPLPYYAYNPGELISVNDISLKTVGFNQYNHATGTANLLGGKQYQITGTYTALSYSTGETITPNSNGIFTPTFNGVLTVTGGNSTNTCVHLTWSGYRNGEYESYWARTRSLPISTYFTGGMKRVGNVYDELAANKAIRRVGELNLGTLSWNYEGEGFFGATVYSIAATNLSSKSICLRYSHGVSEDKFYYFNTPNLITIRDTSYNNATAFKSAMLGVMLYYELATPVETTIDPPLNMTYVESDFGTEEFTSTSSIPIPVPCEILYQNNLVDRLENLTPASNSEMAEVLAALH